MADDEPRPSSRPHLDLALEGPTAVFGGPPAKLPRHLAAEVSPTEAARGHREIAGLVDALIMVVDDEPLNIDMTQAFLEEAGYRNFASTHQSERAIELLRTRKPQVLLLDLTMPKVGGLEILEQMRGDAALRRIPVIVLTSLTDPAVKLRALELGAMDFLSKPVDPSELALRLRNTLVASAYRDFLANHDQLTGLPNRVRYLETVDAALMRATLDQSTGAVLHVGVDRLASINDALGRAAGDVVLQRVARRLRQCVETEGVAEFGATDAVPPTLYRFDGDEFAIVVPDASDMALTATFIMKLLDAATLSFTGAPGREIQVTSSIGVAVFPDDGRDPNTLTSNAGSAMREAKRSGRHTYEFFSRDLGQRASRDLNIGSDLRRAIGAGDLTMVYQPKVDVASGALAGIEAIPSWTNRRGATRTGREVVELANTRDTSMLLTDWMLEQVRADVMRWRKDGRQVLPVGIDVSLAHAPVTELADFVQRTVRAGLPPASLCLELQGASAPGLEPAHVVELLRLRQLGVRLALDHFGSAQSSLVDLQRLTVDEIKVDAAFMGEARPSHSQAAIMAAVAAMARGLRIATVALGVRSAGQFEFAKANRFDQCQGEQPGKPLDAEVFAITWLA